MKRITLTDVAEKAGVSLTAVSRYINQSGYISKEKSNAIKHAIDELGYLPRNIAGVSDFIVLLSVDAPTHSFYQAIWCNFISRAREMGKTVIILTSKNKNGITNDDLPELISQAASLNPEGMIISGFMGVNISPENLRTIKRLPFPVVMFERNGGCSEVSSVTFDEQRAISQAVSHLALLNHKKIGFIGLMHEFSVEKARLDGYYSGLNANNIERNDNLIALCAEYSQEQGRHAMQQLLSRNPDMSAVIICSDLLSVGAVQAINENGFSIPKNISLISHDDNYAQFTSPPLSSIKYPIEQAVDASLSILLQREAKNEDFSIISTSLGLTISHRSSVSPFQEKAH